MECFVLPGALAGDRSIRTEIRQLLDEAENAQKFLWLSCSSYARDLLSRGARKPATKDIEGFVKQMPVIAWYWSRMESRFHWILKDYLLGRDPDDIRCNWLKSIKQALDTAWSRHRTSVSMRDAWTIRALVRAEGVIASKLKDLNREIIELEPQKSGGDKQ